MPAAWGSPSLLHYGLGCLLCSGMPSPCCPPPPPPPQHQPASYPSDDYKVQQAEGFSKVKLFSILDTLLEGTDALLASARERLAAEKGMAALEPWNTGYMMAGDIEKQLDPYFPFETALATWGECFAKLGISYRGATMTLDLLDRKVCVPGTRAG